MQSAEIQEKCKMKINAKLVSNIIKIFISITVIVFNIVYMIINRAIPTIDQQISLLIMVCIIWSVWLPVDASIFVKNLKDIKELTKK